MMSNEEATATPSMAGLKLIEEILRLRQEWAEKHKRANILIAGKTGVGKSTLINTVFRENLADTGMGKPVTQEIREITKPGVPITILDSKGLELAEYESIKNDLLDAVRARRGEDADTYVHLAWICISEESARIEEAELDLARALKGLGVAIVVVVTKVSNFKDNAFEQVVRREYEEITPHIVLTRALEEDLIDDEGTRIGQRKVRGIDELLSLSSELIPESQRQSFANSLSIKHKMSVELKRKEAKLAIQVASSAAFGVGATPIPFADAALLVPVQIAMIMAISRSFGMTVTRDAALPIVTSLLGAGGAALAGRTFISSLFKFFPGLGSVIGGTISAGTAAMLTTAVGEAYLDVVGGIADRGEPMELQAALRHLKGKVGLN